MKVHIGSALLTRIERHLRGRKTEQVAFLFLERTGDNTLVAADAYLVPPSELVHESGFHAEVSEAAQAKIIKAASDRKLLLGEIHSHPGCRQGTEFSASDLSGFEDFVPHVFWRLRVRDYVALVFGDHDFDGLAWVNNADDPLPLDSLVVAGRELVPTGATIRELDRRKKEVERYSRQTAMFGKEGQRRLAQTTVAVTGVGGLGCHVVQQLAYAGARKYVVIDPDRVDRSNLNRFVIGTERDLGRLKVEVAAEFIRRVQPDANVTVVAESLVSRPAFEGITTADFVFGCLDNDGPRLVLLDLCCSAQRPYIDVATDVPGAGVFGGRLLFTGIGKGCLSCREELDQKEVWRFFASPEQHVEDDKIYGIDRAALDEIGPSVVFLNGVVASLAVTEFAAFVTGLRPPVPQLNYRGEMGIVTKPKLSVSGCCYYCDEIWNGRAKTDLDRYLIPSPSTATRP